jgi:predicted phage baseplate assembly protein
MTLDRALDYGYVPESVRIAANVVHATHGETVEEVLGSGDGSAHQQFALRRPPLTFVSAPTATGASSTLEIRVDGVRWDPADRLYGLEPTAERYELSRTDEGGTRVRFGEGEHGARVPTGAENVNARYRTGIGLAGLVGPRRLSLLQTRPLGVRDVVNPLAADGAAEPEDRDAARTAAPLTVRTLDRVVTVADYEDFARGFAGVGKARATLVSAGLRPMVHVSVATATGGVLDPQSDVYRNLQAALAAAGDPGVDVRLAGYRPAPFALAATLLLDQRYESGPVLDAVDDALSEHFSFARREFGQGVSVSEVTAVVLAVPGTIDVTVTRLDVIATADADPATLQDPLLADLARVQANGDIDPAQLLYLSTGGARLAERTA